jgi:hypothetical protein
MNTTEFKKHVTNLLKEENLPTTSIKAKTGDVKNPIDTKSELQKYFRDISSITIPKLNGADSKEIQSFATMIKAILEDLEKGSISPTLQQVLKVYDNRTSNLG